MIAGINLFYLGGDDFSYRGFDELLITEMDAEDTYTVTVGQRYITDLTGNKSTGLLEKDVVVEAE